MLSAITEKQLINNPLTAKRKIQMTAMVQDSHVGTALGSLLASDWPLEVCSEVVRHCYRWGYLMTSRCRRIWAGAVAVLTLWGQCSPLQTPVVTQATQHWLNQASGIMWKRHTHTHTSIHLSINMYKLPVLNTLQTPFLILTTLLKRIHFSLTACMKCS